MRGVEACARLVLLLAPKDDDRPTLQAGEGVDLAAEPAQADDDRTVRLEQAHHVRDRPRRQLPGGAHRGRCLLDRFAVSLRRQRKLRDRGLGQLDVPLEQVHDLPDEHRPRGGECAVALPCRAQAAEKGGRGVRLP